VASCNSASGTSNALFSYKLSEGISIVEPVGNTNLPFDKNDFVTHVLLSFNTGILPCSFLVNPITRP
jgi:hypothetical protein